MSGDAFVDVVEVGPGPASSGSRRRWRARGTVVMTDLALGVERLREAIVSSTEALEEAGATVELITAEALPWGSMEAVEEVAPAG